jgi:hypothetical protein
MSALVSVLVGLAFEQMGGEAVAQRMQRHARIQ